MANNNIKVDNVVDTKCNKLVNSLRKYIADTDKAITRVHHNDGCDYDYGYQSAIDKVLGDVEDIVDEFYE